MKVIIFAFIIFINSVAADNFFLDKWFSGHPDYNQDDSQCQVDAECNKGGQTDRTCALVEIYESASVQL